LTPSPSAWPLPTQTFSGCVESDRCLGASFGLGRAQPEAVGSGLDDMGVEGEPVNNGGDESGITNHLTPLNWNWHRFVWMDLPCWLGKRVPFHDPRFSR